MNSTMESLFLSTQWLTSLASQKLRRPPQRPEEPILVPAQTGQDAAYVSSPQQSTNLPPLPRLTKPPRLVFDNWRVLHGRSAFTGKRRMCGGYSKSNLSFITIPYSPSLRLISKQREKKN